jgi:HK97 family phage portal protein
VQNTTRSIADPAIAAWFSPGGFVNLAGVAVNERSALGLSAFYRALALISGTLASLPFPTYRETEDGQREKVASIFDDPDGPDGQTVYEWKESAFLHLLLHGRAGALKVRTEAGSLARLQLVHPCGFQVCDPTPEEYRSGTLPKGGLWFELELGNGEKVRYDSEDFWYVPGISLDGRHGMSILTYAQTSLGTGIAGDKAAARMFSQGALISGMVTPNESDDFTPDDITEIRRTLDNNVQGHENAGKIAIISRRSNFTAWTMTASDAQFLQSRQFAIEEVSRWTGVPPHLLMQTDKQTSWGTGVEMQDRALGRSVLNTWSTRFEQRASRLLAKPRSAEFDFTALERPAPDREIELDLSQVTAGVMTIDEYRHKRGWGPLPKPKTPPTPTPAPNPDPTEGDNANAS